MNLYLKISVVGFYVLVSLVAMFLQISNCQAEDSSIQLSTYVVETKGVQTINDFDFSTVNININD